ncbi:MAG: endo-1,4-beta-xylanase [Chitinophagales bacterium]
MKSTKLFYLLFAFLIFFTACKENIQKEEAETVVTTPLSLKSAYKDNFYIGAAVNAGQINGENTSASAVLEREFNSITPENVMKSMNIHPKVDTFNFELPDKYVALGEKNNMFIVGHTLVWHSQLSPWLEQIKDSTEMANQLKNHIQTIVGRYKGKIKGWDVVNEALNEDGTLRESVFLKVLGEGYLAQVFEWAAEADPNLELYYNDYNLCQSAKKDGAVALVKKIQDSGAKIDGVGIQAHWSLKEPSIEEIENSILAYSTLGMKVMFTELDVTVLKNPWDLQGADVNQNFEGDPTMNPYPEVLPDSIQMQLAKRYEDIFKLFLKHQDKITRVTFWGINDGQSWLNGWPIKGRTNYPLLFDRDFQPKKAYHSIMALKDSRK